MDRAVTFLNELSRILSEEVDPERALRAITQAVAQSFPADVCSIYVHDPSRNELVLGANFGFPPGSIGAVRMKVDEGLTGLAFSSGEPVAVPVAPLDKRYKYFPQTHEERYPSLLAVPLGCSGRRTGVLVVQTRDVRHFGRDEIDLLRALCLPVSQALEISRLRGVGQPEDGEARARAGRGAQEESDFLAPTFKGVGASPGIAIGPVLVRGYCPEEEDADLLPSDDPADEAERFRQAVDRTRDELSGIRAEASLGAGSEEGSILDAYSLLLEERSIPAKVLAHIEQGHKAESALRIVVVDSMAGLERAEDDYLRDRAYDIQELGRMLLDALTGLSCAAPLPTEGGPYVLVTRSLGVRELLGPGGKNLAGVVSEQGGVHSHASIIARSLGIPLVIGAKGIERNLVDGRSAIVNGSAGLVHLDPPPQVLEAYEKERAAHAPGPAPVIAGAKPRTPVRTVTRDGRRIVIGANVGLLTHLEAAYQMGAEEIGLYRTELPFLIRRSFPGEEEQVALYRQAVERMEGRPVTIRTLDVGGDRELPYLTQSGEENPALGWRSIRISLDREDLFRIQLKAILRVGALGSVRLLLPMISHVEEIRRTRAILAEVSRELTVQGIEHDRQVTLGAMIEVPGAALIIEKILAEVDFVSIGTNDLVQYTLAVDRTNAKVSPLFSPYHPAVLHLIHLVAESGARMGKPVSVCGESASDPCYAALLVGLGVTGLSVDPAAIPALQQALGRARFQELEAIAHKVLKAASVEELRSETFAHLRSVGYSEAPSSNALPPRFIALQYP